MTAHPATFSVEILAAVDRALGPDVVTVLDPFAGTGRIHELRERGRMTFGVEIEPEWAALSEWTETGDSRHLPFDDCSFDAVATSPAYGNRMADQYDGRDGTRRYTYRLALGRPLTDGNGGGLQWGDTYRNLHAEVWGEAVRVLRPGGRLVLNISDHIRKGEIAPVSRWHVAELEGLGLAEISREIVYTRRMRNGANRDERVDGERVIGFKKGGPT
ncbi:hypothetical protein HQ535_15635 [bacterium]|nr:hypothetical protein [bacterium]